MSSEAIVTVVIPTYNRSALLIEAIASVLEQTFQDFVVFVSDNASVDDTQGAVASFNDSRITYHRHPRNIGGQRNWRFALTYPQTRYVALLEDDNLWMPEHLERAIYALESRNASMMYAGKTQKFGAVSDDEFHVPYWYNGESGLDWLESDNNYARWLAGCPFAASSVVTRSSSLESLYWGGRDWPWCMDYLWWGQIALKGPYAFDSEVHVKYRVHATQWMGSVWKHRRSGAQWTHTIRSLTLLAHESGNLTADQLFSEVVKWPVILLIPVVVALSAPDCSIKPLRETAHRLYDARRDDLRVFKGSGQHMMVGRLGKWYLDWADVVGRIVGLWWPTTRPI